MVNKFYKIVKILNILHQNCMILRKHHRHPVKICKQQLFSFCETEWQVLSLPIPYLVIQSDFPSHKDMDWGRTSCFLFEMMGETAPQMFHNASIWLTLVLATQRYIYICKATRSVHRNLIIDYLI